MHVRDYCDTRRYTSYSNVGLAGIRTHYQQQFNQSRWPLRYKGLPRKLLDTLTRQRLGKIQNARQNFLVGELASHP